MPQPEAVRSVAALAAGKRVMVVLPKRGSEEEKAALLEQADAPSVTQEWATLFLERDAAANAKLDRLSERVDALHEKVHQDGSDSVANLAARLSVVEDTQRTLAGLLQQLHEGNTKVATLLALPVVPEYDKKGKLIAARRIVK